MTQAEKQAIIKEYATHEGDTGSPEVQVAVLTTRINELTEHLKVHKKVCHLPIFLIDDKLCVSASYSNHSVLTYSIYLCRRHI